MSAKYRHHQIIAWLFMLPQLVVTVIFFIWPACSAMVQSFFFSDAFGLHRHYSGLSHFWELLHSHDYRVAVWVSLILAVSVTIITMSLGLFLAALVHGRIKGQAIYKSLLLWPYAVAPAVAAILWRFLCHPTLGWVTEFLAYFGYELNYLIHPNQALGLIIATASWQQLSYNFLFYFAALKMIPLSYIDAAILDGASAWHRFWGIIVPLLSPTSFFLLIMNFIYAFFDTFGIIHVMTHGGPGYSTTTLIYKVVEDGFVGMDPGSSSAQSVMLMLLVIGLTLLQFRYLENKVHYE